MAVDCVPRGVLAACIHQRQVGALLLLLDELHQGWNLRSSFLQVSLQLQLVLCQAVQKHCHKQVEQSPDSLPSSLTALRCQPARLQVPAGTLGKPGKQHQVETCCKTFLKLDRQPSQLTRSLPACHPGSQ